MSKYKKLLDTMTVPGYMSLTEADGSKTLKDSKFSPIENDIIAFFVDNPNPKDDAIHKFANEKKIDEHEFEGIIYKILSSLIHLKGSDAPDSDFDAKELKMGIKVEQEHHEHDMIAKNIAKAHLLEIPDYYTRLAKMEGDAGVEDE